VSYKFLHMNKESPSTYFTTVHYSVICIHKN
jgi:hypothetical protein